MAFNLEDFMNDSSMKFRKDSAKGEKTVMLPASKLIPADGNFYSKDMERVRKLAASIEMLSTKERLGIQQDLIVKPIEGTDTYEIIAGETRWSAVNLLLEEGRISSDLVPCRVERSGDAVREELILILTNSTQRERSDAEKLQEIGRLRVLLTEYKKTHSLSGTVQQAIADILGVSKTKVGTLENIKRHLSDDLMQQFRDGKINTSVANMLAGKPEEFQSLAYDFLISKGSMTASDVNMLEDNFQEKSDAEKEQQECGENSSEENITVSFTTNPINDDTSSNNLDGDISFKLEMPKEELSADECPARHEEDGQPLMDNADISRPENVASGDADVEIAVRMLDMEIQRENSLISAFKRCKSTTDNEYRKLKHQTMLDAYRHYREYLLKRNI